MPNEVKKIGKKFRVVEAGTNRIVKNKKGTAVDGGGHKSKAAATRQAQAINISQARQHGEDIPEPKHNVLKGAKFS